MLILKSHHNPDNKRVNNTMYKLSLFSLVLVIVLVGSAYARWGLTRPTQSGCGDKGPTADVYPWNAVLEHDSPDGKYRSLSKGFLISDRHVLTSVSSIHNAQENWQLTGIRLGMGIPTFGTVGMEGETYPVESISIHETLDLALIKLEIPVNITDEVRPICLPESERFDSSNADLMVTSHCKRFFESETGEPGSLKEKTTVASLNATLVNHDFCSELYRRAGTALLPEQSCVWDTRGDTCSGDLGGALMVRRRDKYFVVGIGSYLPTTANVPLNVFPAVYTDVVKTLAWVVKALKDSKDTEN